MSLFRCFHIKKNKLCFGQTHTFYLKGLLALFIFHVFFLLMTEGMERLIPVTIVVFVFAIQLSYLTPSHLHQERMHNQYCNSPLTALHKVFLVLQTLIMNNPVGFNTRKLTKLMIMGICLTFLNAWDFLKKQTQDWVFMGFHSCNILLICMDMLPIPTPPILHPFHLIEEVYSRFSIQIFCNFGVCSSTHRI